MAGMLTLLALWLPQPLYLVALSCFGLPHVLWELRWVRNRTALGNMAVLVGKGGHVLIHDHRDNENILFLPPVIPRQ